MPREIFNIDRYLQSVRNAEERLRLRNFGNQMAAESKNFTFPLPEHATVLYRDSDLFIVNKPPGIVSSVSPGHPIGVEELTKRMVSGWINRVNRLDKGTSGIMVLAANDEAATDLGRQFELKESNNTEKIYLAMCEGELGTTDPVLIEGHIGYDAQGTGSIQDYRGGKYNYSKTLLTPIGSDTVDGKQVTLVVAQLLSGGKKHQIRVASQHAGIPLIGDWRYNPNASNGRALLHSWKLGINHPTTKERLIIEAPIPDDMQEFVAPFQHLLLP